MQPTNAKISSPASMYSSLISTLSRSQTRQLLLAGHFTQNPCRGILSVMEILRQLNFPGCHNVAVTELWNYSKWNIAGQRAAWCSHRDVTSGCALWNRRDNQGVRLDRELCGTSVERNGGRPGEPLSENSAGLTHFAITMHESHKRAQPSGKTENGSITSRDVSAKLSA